MNLVEVNIIGEQFDAIELIRKKVNFECKDEPLYICNVSDIINKFHTWTKYMPRVVPFYGMYLQPHICWFYVSWKRGKKN